MQNALFATQTSVVEKITAVDRQPRAKIFGEYESTMQIVVIIAMHGWA